jgi:bifunctional enzyme CysN/CysC
VFLLDGDLLRQGLSKDLGFSEVDRAENLRRAAEVAGLIADRGFIVLATFITPRQVDRDGIRARLSRSLGPSAPRNVHGATEPKNGDGTFIGASTFVEAFVDTTLAVAETRDVKGLYRKARRGEISNLTGVGQPFEAPEAPDIRLDTSSHDADSLAVAVLDALVARRVLPPDCLRKAAP